MGWRAWLVCAVLVLAAAFALYGPGLTGGFVWDDFGYVQAFGQRFETVGAIEALQWLWVPRPEYGLQNYRPFLELSYVYEWRLWGLDPTGYRLTNLLLHAGSSLLLAALAHRLTGSRLAAVAAGVLFAASPAHPETCLWLAARVNLLATFFMLAALLSFVARRRLLAVLFALFALGSKETAFALPPMLSAFALLDATGSLRARAVAALRSTWIHWALLALFLALRYHVIHTFVGGYAWRAPPDVLSLEYLRERLELVLVTLSPVNFARSPEGLRWGLLAAHATLLAVVLWAAARGRARAATMFVLAWFAFAQVPIYNAPFGAATVETMQSSRLLYEPTAALVVGLAFALARLRSRVLAAVVAGLYFAVAWANAGPWLETVRTSAAIDAAARSWCDEEFGTRLVADLPAFHDGAFLFPDRDPSLLPLFHDEAVLGRVELTRSSQWRRVLRRIDAHLESGRADGFELFAARIEGRNDVRIEREPIDERMPIPVHEELVVRCARYDRFDPRVDGELRVDVLVDCRGAAAVEPLVFRLVGADGPAASYTRAAPEEPGRQPIRATLPLPPDLSPGRYEVELSARDRTVRIASVDLARARWWP